MKSLGLGVEQSLVYVTDFYMVLLYESIGLGLQARTFGDSCSTEFRHPGTYPKNPVGFFGYTHLKTHTST